MDDKPSPVKGDIAIIPSSQKMKEGNKILRWYHLKESRIIHFLFSKKRITHKCQGLV